MPLEDDNVEASAAALQVVSAVQSEPANLTSDRQYVRPSPAFSIL